MKYYAFRRQPFKALYTAGSILALIFVRLPFWAIAYLAPGLRPRRNWSIGRCLIVLICQSYSSMLFATEVPVTQPIDHAPLEENDQGFVWIEPVFGSLIVGEIKDMAEVNGVEAVRVGGYWIGPRGRTMRAGEHALQDEKVIYHIHGGAYFSWSASPSFIFMKTCYAGFLEHFPDGPRIFSLEYRLSSAPPSSPVSNPCPAAIIDAVAGYRYLVQELGFKPQNIILSGDSAGGNIALCLALYLARSALPGLPPPRALLLLSPAADWGNTHLGPGSSLLQNATTDYIQHAFLSNYTARALVGNLPLETAATSVWISPASLKLEFVPGLFAGLPRTCIFVGQAELALDQARTLRERIQADNGEDAVNYMEWADVTHDAVCMPWHEPERTKALREIAKWLQSI
ncbi:hypothetical protein POSPLADRAFT_1184883 [Postia placenta MAD-698-R-SB12]|uniref:Alpha/beta hydrolase fold-3 domain-containing protein n=1 Tax=Postia placenta MAD-698-R-SB12 TaxID=670580 RepID=A0A1X6MQP5_9APHY|nr:hypothetical protein POSPLADRAFT_1184883 [Postia placenta MAD-698-R-SB12]OSX58473.1 hypothetical protein POSPLADRAFT_1184883 [Postia placenta MAD-698-R-SB12]